MEQLYSEKPRGETPEERLRPPEVLPPTGTFKEVWGEDWGRRLGEKIGKSGGFKRNSHSHSI